MSRVKLIEDMKVYKKRLKAIVEYFNIDTLKMAKYIGVNYWRIVYYNPNKEQLKLLAEYCRVSEDFLKGNKRESYLAREVELLIYLEKENFKEEFKKIKKEFANFYQAKFREYYKD